MGLALRLRRPRDVRPLTTSQKTSGGFQNDGSNFQRNLRSPEPSGSDDRDRQQPCQREYARVQVQPRELPDAAVSHDGRRHRRSEWPCRHESDTTRSGNVRRQRGHDLYSGHPGGHRKGDGPGPSGRRVLHPGRRSTTVLHPDGDLRVRHFRQSDRPLQRLRPSRMDHRRGWEHRHRHACGQYRPLRPADRSESHRVGEDAGKPEHRLPGKGRDLVRSPGTAGDRKRRGVDGPSHDNGRHRRRHHHHLGGWRRDHRHRYHQSGCTHLFVGGGTH